MAASAKELRQLITKKDELEKEMKALSEVLQSQEGVGMDGALVDAEGYPRADIDVYSVRHARHQIICLQNDHRVLMSQIEEGLYAAHAAARESTHQGAAGEEAAGGGDPAPGPAVLRGFARVDRVDSGSPAQTAGLEVHDLVTRFGSVELGNFRSLQDIGRVVQHSTGRPLSVSVCRQGKDVSLTLTPQSWAGQGLLGCNIVPLKT